MRPVKVWADGFALCRLCRWYLVPTWYSHGEAVVVAQMHVATMHPDYRPSK